MRAQGFDANLMREATLVRAEIASSAEGLRQYTWTEKTQVLVGGSIKSMRAFNCHYDASGQLVKTPLDTDKERDKPAATSKRPLVRRKADMQDYIERAVSRIHNYVPPEPKQIDYLLQNGQASLGQSANANSEIRLTHYFEERDSFVFTYDSVSKVLRRATIASTLGSPKDPVTLEAVFETLPDGVNHLSSAVLNAKKKNVVVKTSNLDYRKTAP
jgi:hypothetical protein